jgi:hypothetical protein
MSPGAEIRRSSARHQQQCRRHQHHRQRLLPRFRRDRRHRLQRGDAEPAGDSFLVTTNFIGAISASNQAE